MTELAATIMSAPSDNTYLFSVGQAGYIIKSSTGRLLAVDLYLSDCVERDEGHTGFKRLLPRILRPDEICFDVIITTHPHLDHFDMDSIPWMMSKGSPQLLCSTECRKLVELTGLDYYGDRITYVRPGDCIESGDFMIRFVNCDHGTGAPDAVGVVIEVDGKRIYEAGDTCLRLDRTEEIRKLGNIDVMIAPINGAYGNLNETECVELSKALRPALTIPCHYGMFAAHGGSPGLFLDEIRKTDLNYRIMSCGESLKL